MRVTIYPAPTPSARKLERLSWALALLSAALLLAACLGSERVAGLGRHLAADYHYWAGREAYKRGEAQIEVQREWQAAIAADPRYNRVRLDLARSYIDTQWYGGAIAQAEAVLKGRRSRQEASLAYTYLGYSHYMLGERGAGVTELELAVQRDAQNSLAQSVLERLRTQGKLPPLK